MRQFFAARRSWLASLGLAAALLAGSAAVEAQSCSFRTSLPGVISFGALDPSLATDLTTPPISVSIQCGGGAKTPLWTFSGSNGNAPLQMKHTGQSTFIPYSVAATFAGGGVGNQQWNISATILGASYQNAVVGTYSDVLRATINP